MKNKFGVKKIHFWNLKDKTWGIGAYIHKANKDELYLMIELLEYIFIIGWFERVEDSE